MTNKAVNVGTPGHIDHGTPQGASELKAMLAGQDAKTLAGWWCELNNWGWPSGLGTPERKDEPHRPRRTAIMSAIEKKIGHKRCLAEWNHEDDG